MGCGAPGSIVLIRLHSWRRKLLCKLGQAVEVELGDSEGREKKTSFVQNVQPEVM